MQQKTQLPVQFEITEQPRMILGSWMHPKKGTDLFFAYAPPAPKNKKGLHSLQAFI
ncbi:hypothetical protein [Pseudomonas putida]|uniref:hypothetical protein n=1 Tax=Pseudomonas putida TaxID=303 RepID=UPI003D324E96